MVRKYATEPRDPIKSELLDRIESEGHARKKWWKNYIKDISSISCLRDVKKDLSKRRDIPKIEKNLYSEFIKKRIDYLWGR